MHDFTLNEEVLLTIDDLGDLAARIQWIKSIEKGLGIMGGPDLLLKKFADTGGVTISDYPVAPTR